jgi:DNA-3-methyladenine glycosylase
MQRIDRRARVNFIVNSRMPDRRRSSAGPPGSVIGLDFFGRDTLEVARDLLGKVLVRQVRGHLRWGRLVEVEAYLGPEDLAAHSAGGRRTPRTEVMYGAPGHAYVYFVYGMHHCLNIVTGPVGSPHAVLVRAMEPGGGVDRANGPAVLCRALEIDRALNGIALEPPTLYLVDDGGPARRVFATPRIGVAYSAAWAQRPWRFCWDSPSLSRPLGPLRRSRR